MWGNDMGNEYSAPNNSVCESISGMGRGREEDHDIAWSINSSVPTHIPYINLEDVTISIMGNYINC